MRNRGRGFSQLQCEREKGCWRESERRRGTQSCVVAKYVLRTLSLVGQDSIRTCLRCRIMQE